MKVTWLMKNPFGATARPGERGDFVRVSDGRATIYLLPNEFDLADERSLRWLLARQPTRVLRGAARAEPGEGGDSRSAPPRHRSARLAPSR